MRNIVQTAWPCLFPWPQYRTAIKSRQFFDDVAGAKQFIQT
jgi:hypothetical protein